MKALDLEATQKQMEVAIKPQKPHNEHLEMDTIGSLGDQYLDRHLVVRRHLRKWT
jgi:hypothetical protein